MQQKIGINYLAQLVNRHTYLYCCLIIANTFGKVNGVECRKNSCFLIQIKNNAATQAVDWNLQIKSLNLYIQSRNVIKYMEKRVWFSRFVDTHRARLNPIATYMFLFHFSFFFFIYVIERGQSASNSPSPPCSIALHCDSNQNT